MKLKYGIIALLAAAMAFTACEQQEPDHFLSQVTVTNADGARTSYVALPKAGGSVIITVNAQDAWTIGDTADWLTVSPKSGAAGETKVTVSAEKPEERRETSFTISCLDKTQIINVVQEADVAEKPELPITPIATVIAQGDGTYRVRGTVTRVVNDQYGNFYMVDESYDGSSFQIYGTKNEKGQYPKDAPGGWESFGIEAGDIVTVEGPYSLYNTTHELVDVSVIKIEKSLIEISAPEFETIPAEGSTFELTITSKVNPTLVTSSESWLHVTDIKEGGVYVFVADANTSTASRTADINVKAPGAVKSLTVTQDGVPATGASITEIVAMADNSKVETLESTVVALTTKGAVISDGTTAVYVYGATAAALKEGDNVKVFGKKTTYNGVPEITDLTEVSTISSGNTVKHPSSKNITENAGDYTASVAEYISLTGTLVKSGNYYNISLDAFTDGSKQGSIVYPVEALNAASFDGKKITVTGYFNGLSSAGKYINIIATKIEEAGVVTGSTIAEIIAMADASAVETQEVLVAALTTRGAVISDGTSAVYVYGNSAAALKIGDKVKMTANKTTYNGVPELTDPTISVVSNGNAVTYPTAKDITADAGTYAATVAEYVSLTGTLAKSGNYYNITLDAFPDGSKTGSIVYPVDALNAASFNGQKITVTGYFNGLSSKGKFINIIATGIEAAASGPSFAIDGNFDEWADIPEFASEQNSRIRLWKFASDANNVYFYFKLRGDRIGKKMYIAFDTDNNEATGSKVGNVAGTEVGVLTFPVAEGTETFANGFDPLTQLNEKVNATLAKWAGGMGTDGEAYVELSMSRSTLGLPASGTIAIGCSYDWYVTGKQTVTL